MEMGIKTNKSSRHNFYFERCGNGVSLCVDRMKATMVCRHMRRSKRKREREKMLDDVVSSMRHQI